MFIANIVGRLLYKKGGPQMKEKQRCLRTLRQEIPGTQLADQFGETKEVLEYPMLACFLDKMGLSEGQ